MAGEVEKIKERIDIVDFLKSYIDLKPAGRNFRALCPFHQEKTPSFVVSPERKMWRCFGACGEGGDAIKFLMKYENLEFYEALKVLAEKVGIPFHEMSPREQKEFGILYDINDAAKDFFKEELERQKEAQVYLKDRGLNNETINEFELGFSPGGEVLTLNLLKLGYEIGDIARAGLIFKNHLGLYRDKFEGRVMFPIFNSMGKVVAFTGRIMPGADKDSDVPKYVNSQETPIFNKSKILYGFHKSKNEIAKTREVFLVEGQMDFLMAWQSGIKNTIAVSGTALTASHLEKMKRFADTAIMSFDADEAGFKALERALDIFGNFDFYVKVAELGKFKDPADACREDKGFLLKAISVSRSAFTYLFESHFKKTASEDVAAKKRLIANFLKKISNLRSVTEQNICIKELARVSGVPESALLSEFELLRREIKETEEVSGDAREEPDLMHKDKADMLSERLIILSSAEPKFLEQLKELEEYLPLAYRDILYGSKKEERYNLDMRASYEFKDCSKEISEKEFNDSLRYLQMEALKKKQFELRKKIRESEAGEDEAMSSQLLDEFYKTSKRLEELKKYSIKTKN